MNQGFKRAALLSALVGCVSVMAGCGLQIQHLTNGEKANGDVLFSTGSSSTTSLSSETVNYGGRTVVINVPAGTCNAHWYIEGFKGSYPAQWNQEALIHREAHARMIRQPMLSPAESRARLVGPQLGDDTTAANFNCYTNSYLGGKHAGITEANQGIYSLTQ
jgi:hypothetical protein